MLHLSSLLLAAALIHSASLKGAESRGRDEYSHGMSEIRSIPRDRRAYRIIEASLLQTHFFRAYFQMSMTIHTLQKAGSFCCEETLTKRCSTVIYDLSY